MRENSTIMKNRDYLTNFYRRRSIIALCSGICALALSFYGIIAAVIRTVEIEGANGFTSFIFFTRISNTLAALSVAFVIPFAVEGIKKRRLVLPKWVAMLHYMATTSIAITLAFVLTFISWSSPGDAFGGFGVFMHVVCPSLILISFFQIENGYIYTVKNRLIGGIPFYIYGIVYFIEVVFIGEANGGWPDLYQIQKHISPAIALPVLMLFGLCISWIVAIISNYLTKKREEKMFKFWKKDVDPIEAKIEAYGLGNMMSQIRDENNIQIPLDILNHLAKKAHLNTEDLIKPYITGLINSKKERDINN